MGDQELVPRAALRPRNYHIPPGATRQATTSPCDPGQVSVIKGRPISTFRLPRASEELPWGFQETEGDRTGDARQVGGAQNLATSFLFLFVWLHHGLVVACRTFWLRNVNSVVACGGSSPLIRDRT